MEEDTHRIATGMIFLLLLVVLHDDDSVNAKTLRVKLANFIIIMMMIMMTGMPNPKQQSISLCCHHQLDPGTWEFLDISFVVRTVIVR
jgi:hypothetical protein